MENSSNKRRNLIQGFFISVLVILVVSAGYSVYYFSSIKKAVAQSCEAASYEEFMAVSDSTLLGTYSVRIESVKDTSRLNGFIDKDSLGAYVLHILSEYEPRIITLQAADSTLFCDELGTARIVCGKNTDKITVKFEKEGFICTLVR